MATIIHDTSGRTSQSGTSNRTVATVKDDAKFSKLRTVSAGITDLTGSFKGSSGFIVTTAGDSVIWPTEGDTIAASSLTAKTLYEIGVRRISGSGTVSVVY
jgi:hypothetical protein